MIDENLIEGLREYLKDNYVPALPIFPGLHAEVIERFGNHFHYQKQCKPFRNISEEVEEYINVNKQPGSFAHKLDKIREEKGLSPSELYNKANIDRRLYSRLMGPGERHPSKNTVMCFALALELNRKEFDDLLQSAGYALNNTSSGDVCIMYCLEEGIYSIDDVNALLFTIGIDPLTRE